MVLETLSSFSYFLIAVCLIALDKTTTYHTILAVHKKYPRKDALSVEKNPLAIYFFKKFGLFPGTFFYAIFSLFSFFFAVWLLDFLFSYAIAFTVIAVIYVLVIINNFRWLIKYSR